MLWSKLFLSVIPVLVVMSYMTTETQEAEDQRCVWFLGGWEGITGQNYRGEYILSAKSHGVFGRQYTVITIDSVCLYPKDCTCESDLTLSNFVHVLVRLRAWTLLIVKVKGQMRHFWTKNHKSCWSLSWQILKVDELGIFKQQSSFILFISSSTPSV